MFLAPRLYKYTKEYDALSKNTVDMQVLGLEPGFSWRVPKLEMTTDHLAPFLIS